MTPIGENEMASHIEGTIYLLHFETAHEHAQHYLGWALDHEERVKRHKAGNGARLPQVFAEKGIRFVVARLWQGTRFLERKLKNRHNHRRLCPVCRGEVTYEELEEK
jgi:putative endonuclease